MPLRPCLCLCLPAALRATRACYCRVIFPIGYRVSREYPSMINPEASTLYLCEIADGGSSPQVCAAVRLKP